LETFGEPRDFVKNERYAQARKDALAALDMGAIDAPIVDIVAGFAKLPHCFTLQCCNGHFLWEGQNDRHNLDELPARDPGMIRYRIAYLALCIKKGKRGANFRERLAAICETDRAYVQFGSPDWFWQQYPNSYALQVEPTRDMFLDEALLEHAEALHVQSIRDEVFQRVRKLLEQGGNSIR
jgi:hypothetical protein